MIVDTHVHVIAPDAARYPLRPSGVGIAVVPGASGERRGVPRRPRPRAASTARCSCRRTARTAADNTYVLDAVGVAPDRFVSVVIVDPGDPDPPHAARACRGARVPRRAAVRHRRRPRRRGSTATSGVALWDTAAELDLRIVATLLAPELPAAACACSARHADVPVVLDHCGFPDLRGGPPFAGRGAAVRAGRRSRPAPQGHVARARRGRRVTLRRFVEQLSRGVRRRPPRVGLRLPADPRPLVRGARRARTRRVRRAPGRRPSAFLGGNALRLWPALTA